MEESNQQSISPRSFGDLTYTTGDITYNLAPIIGLIILFFIFRIASLIGFDSFGGDSSGYGAPSSSYGAPSPSYGAPAPSYGAPEPSYGAPAPSYGTPSTGYSTGGITGTLSGTSLVSGGAKNYQQLYANLGALNSVQDNIGNIDYTDNSVGNNADYLTRLLQVQSLLGGQNVQQQVYNPYLTTTYQYQQ